MSVDLLAEARRRLDAGDPGSAHRLGERALESSRASGAQKETAAAAKLVAECLYVVGNIDGARRLLDEALARSEAVGDRAALGAALQPVGRAGDHRRTSRGRDRPPPPLIRPP